MSAARPMSHTGLAMYGTVRTDSGCTRHICQRPVPQQLIADLLCVLHIPQEVGMLLHAWDAEGAALYVVPCTMRFSCASAGLLHVLVARYMLGG